MRLLITGASGFIGRHVVSAASARGHQLRLLGHSSSAAPASGGMEYFTRDLRRREGLADPLRGIDTVIHCAALMAGSEADQHAVTVGGTEHLLEAMETAGVSHIVLVSTFALYDYLRLAPGSALTEDSPLDDAAIDRAPYVRVKRHQEDLVRDFGRRRGWRVTILRPGLVYGPARTWFHHLGIRLSSRLWISLAGSATLPLTYVENCADAIVLASEIPAAAGATINIVDDNLPARHSYMRDLARRASPSPLIADLPWNLLSAGAHGGNLAGHILPGGTSRLPDLVRPASLAARCKPLTYPNSHAKSVLGWSPRWTLREALEKSF